MPPLRLLTLIFAMPRQRAMLPMLPRYAKLLRRHYFALLDAARWGFAAMIFFAAPRR